MLLPMPPLRADDVAPTPWKNGGGVARELLCAPDATNWLWRISLADVNVDGPFSAYPGVQRWFAVVSGGGVELDFAGRLLRLHAGEQALCFDGAAAPACRLIGGPTRDLNLMLQGGARGVMHRGRAGEHWHDAWPLRGRFDIASATLHWSLPPGSTCAPADCLWLGVAP